MAAPDYASEAKIPLASPGASTDDPKQLDTSKNRRIMSNWAQEEAAAGG